LSSPDVGVATSCHARRRLLERYLVDGTRVVQVPGDIGAGG
jgi:hypothetical protein